MSEFSIHLLIMHRTMRLILPSNSSLSFFPNNTLGTYTTQLPIPLELDEGKYECGLAEIQYTKSWKNVANGEIKFAITTRREVIQKAVKLLDGHYDSCKELEKRINEAIEEKKLSNYLRLLYDPVNGRMALFINNKDRNTIKLKFSPSLRAILGLENEEDYHETLPNSSRVKTVYGSKPVDLHNGFYNIYVYSDLIKSTVVGDTEAPLLRIVPVQGEKDTQQTITFNRIHFVPLSRKNINTATVYLRKDNGEVIPFERGKTVVTLLIRRARLH